jgi:dTDP-4-amino-4,6-dideoxygalactose transaminase
MGIEQLKKLKKINKVRRENAKYLTKKLSTLTKYIYIPSVNKNEKSAYYGFPFMVKKTSLRNKLAKYLEQNDIETRAIMGGCLPDQPAFINQKHRIYKKLLNSRIVKNSGIFIGIHSALEKKHLDKIAITLKNFFKKYP